MPDFTAGLFFFFTSASVKGANPQIVKENFVLPQSQSTRKFFRGLLRFFLLALVLSISTFGWHGTAAAAQKEKKQSKKPAAAAPAKTDPAAQPKPKYEVGEDPEFAKKSGWPVQMPPTPEGAILPAKRIVAYYGNPQSKEDGGAWVSFPRTRCWRA